MGTVAPQSGYLSGMVRLSQGDAFKVLQLSFAGQVEDSEMKKGEGIFQMKDQHW